MIAAKIMVALGEAPGNRQAGDVAAGKRASLVRPQHGCAHSICIVSFRMPGGVERYERVLPSAPSSHEKQLNPGKAIAAIKEMVVQRAG
jgi:hypothetical protein